MSSINPNDSFNVLISSYHETLKGKSLTAALEKAHSSDENVASQMNDINSIYQKIGQFFDTVNHEAFETLKKASLEAQLPTTTNPFSLAMMAEGMQDSAHMEAIGYKPSQELISEASQVRQAIGRLEAAIEIEKDRSLTDVEAAINNLARSLLSFIVPFKDFSEQLENNINRA